MYASIDDVRRILPPSINIGDQNLGTPSPGVPAVKRDQLTPDSVIQYIRFAQQEVDSRLRPFYVCPLRRIKSFETDILENVSPGTSVNIRVWDSNQFAKGDTVRIQSKDTMELATVSNTSDERYVTVAKVLYSYNVDGSKISVVEFPDPIPIITARLAVSFAFDQLFNAQQAPDISQYGVEQRKLALNAIDSILSGTVLLFGQDHTGRRFVRGSLFDAYDNPTKEFQFGRERS